MGTPDLRLRELSFALLVIVVSSYAWMFSRVSVPNERTRAYLTVALVDHGTLAVDEPLRRFGSVYDLAQFEGRYFTDKAPGSSLLAVPIYALVRLATQPGDWSIVELCNLFRTWVILPFGFAGFLLLRSLLRTLGVSPGAIRVSSLAFSLGTPMLHYSNAFYGHVPVAVLVLGALRCLAIAGVIGPRDVAAHGGSDPAGLAPSVATRSKRFAALAGAGACAGLAGLIEYQAIVLGAVLTIPILLSGRRRILPNLALYALGAVPFAVALLVYNARAFGSPFALSYQHLVGQSLQDLHGFGLAGTTRPSLDVLRQMLTSVNRGLVTTAPFLAFGLAALPLVFRRLGAALWSAALLGSVYFVLIVSSSSVWYGGWSFGLRLLIPVFGLLALGAAVGFDAVARFAGAQTTVRAAAVFSVLYHQLVNVTFPELPPEFEHPLPDSVLPMLKAGLVAPNIGCKLIGLAPTSLMPLGLALVVVVACIAWPDAKDLLPARTVKTHWRVLHAAVPVLVACLALLILVRAAPSRPEREQARWVKMAQGWHDGETSCREVTPPHQ
ncbi:MAG TPA: hypothetical protein VFG30_13545 [Polyangiales bacterium]|nr:hypothetical protein [Polyangiales bacterium]